ncbi:hypothetical protein [Mycobacteroides salmoniphilum]|uniref:hypothetical protein n=1 Tax=Mycobacteroides salmoniphilum TaxID=404941 RepID=UPI0010666EDD|nr:hypothetical protein [Mycobacteroides salmoniphilum]TDZ99307.1 hypothetical protein CCUG62472_00545 [Mycobacteroides salmoniphilum]
MTDDDERQAITAAMHRLLTGKPLRSSGHLDIVTLAQEAGVKRNKLTHKHKDLKELFYAECAAREQVPDNEIKLRNETAALKEQNQRLRDERDRYKHTNEIFARAIHILTIENDKLRTQNETTRLERRAGHTQLPP